MQLPVSVEIACAADLPGESASRILRGADTAMCKVKTGQEEFPYPATRADACAETVNGRRTGRTGPHLPATNWRGGMHFSHWGGEPCVLCGNPTPLRSHAGEAVHRTCAEDWNAARPEKAIEGRFVSDPESCRRTRDASGDHA